MSPFSALSCSVRPARPSKRRIIEHSDDEGCATPSPPQIISTLPVLSTAPPSPSTPLEAAYELINAATAFITSTSAGGTVLSPWFTSHVTTTQRRQANEWEHNRRRDLNELLEKPKPAKRGDLESRAWSRLRTMRSTFSRTRYV